MVRINVRSGSPFQNYTIVEGQNSNYRDIQRRRERGKRQNGTETCRVRGRGDTVFHRNIQGSRVRRHKQCPTETCREVGDRGHRQCPKGHAWEEGEGTGTVSTETCKGGGKGNTDSVHR